MGDVLDFISLEEREALHKEWGTLYVYGYCMAATKQERLEQKKEVQAYCKDKGLLLKYTYQEECDDTKSLVCNRKYALDMLEKIAEGEASAIVVTTRSIFSTNSDDYIPLLALLEKNGVQLLCATVEDVCSLSKFTDKTRQQMSERRKAFIKERRELGEVINVVPYGYMLEGKKLIPNPVEQQVIEMAKELRRKEKKKSDGKGYKLTSIVEVASILNSKGLLAREGKEWTARSITPLLKSKHTRSE